jgi:alkyl hydroperoxide reductase subunit AhpC
LDLTYLAALQHLMPEFEELSVDVVAVSADTRSAACSFVDDLRGAVLAVSSDTRAGRIHFKVAYGLNEEQMRRWGLYVSRPLSPDEATHLYAEPAVYLVNPAGLLHAVALSNASWARSDLKQIAQGIRMVQDKKMPIRGTY